MRRAQLIVTYNGADISADISDSLTEFSFTDRAHGKQDDISIGLQDKRGLWRGAWMPSKGATLRAAIQVLDWLRPGDNRRLDCGQFSVDEIEYRFPPSEMHIGAVSVSIDSDLRQELKTRGWQATTLRGIAASVAKSSGLDLLYDARVNPHWKRVDQREESDAALVERLCRAAALNCKVTAGKLVIFSGSDYDQLPAVATFTPDSPDLISGQFQTKTDQVYRGCTCSYWNPKLQRLVHHTYYPKNAPRSGKLLKLNGRYESKAQADDAAKAALRNSNGQEYTGALRLMGRPDIAAGQNVEISGWGGFDRKFAVAEARHTYSNSGGYTSELSLRTTLED